MHISLAVCFFVIVTYVYYQHKLAKNRLRFIENLKEFIIDIHTAHDIHEIFYIYEYCRVFKMKGEFNEKEVLRLLSQRYNKEDNLSDDR